MGMMLGIAAFLFVFLVPALAAFLVRLVLRNDSRWLQSAIIILCAAGPATWLFLSAREADGITNAGSYYVAPILFVLALPMAGFGLVLAERKARRGR